MAYHPTVIWEPWKLNYLIQYHCRIPDREIGQTIGLSTFAVQQKRVALFGKKRFKYRLQINEYIIDHRHIHLFTLKQHLDYIWHAEGYVFQLQYIKLVLREAGYEPVKAPYEFYDKNKKSGAVPHKAGEIIMRKKQPWYTIRPGVFIPYKKHEWEQAYGPVPKTFDVHVKDGNEFNVTLNNLELRKKIQGITTAREELSDKWLAGILFKRDRRARELVLKIPDFLILQRFIKKQKQLNDTKSSG